MNSEYSKYLLGPGKKVPENLNNSSRNALCKIILREPLRHYFAERIQ
jgi:hypothetical protein